MKPRRAQQLSASAQVFILNSFYVDKELFSVYIKVCIKIKNWSQDKKKNVKQIEGLYYTKF